MSGGWTLGLTGAQARELIVLAALVVSIVTSRWLASEQPSRRSRPRV